MVPLLKGLVVFCCAGVAFASPFTFASECEQRLGFGFATLVERALDQGVISLEGVKRLAESSAPFNPIEAETSISANASFKRVFAAQLMQIDWPSERAKLVSLVEARTGQVEIAAVAAQDTKRVLNPHEIGRYAIGEGWAPVAAISTGGRLYYAQVTSGDKTVNVYEAGNPQPVFVLPHTGSNYPMVDFGFNREGHLCVEIKNWLDHEGMISSIKHIFSTKVERLVYDLETKTVSKTYEYRRSMAEVYTPSGLTPARTSVSLDRSISKFPFLGWKLNVPGEKSPRFRPKLPNLVPTTYAAKLPSGRKFVAVHTATSVEGETFQVFEPERQSDPVHVYRTADWLGFGTVLWAEQDGSPLMVTVSKSLAYVYDLDGGAQTPIAKIALNRGFRSGEIFQLANGELRIVFYRNDPDELIFWSLNSDVVP